MQVDIVGIGKFEFDEAQAVIAAWPLPQKELAVSEAIERFFGRWGFFDAVATCIDDIVGILHEVRGVFFDLRHEPAALNFRIVRRGIELLGLVREGRKPRVVEGRKFGNVQNRM